MSSPYFCGSNWWIKRSPVSNNPTKQTILCCQGASKTLRTNPVPGKKGWNSGGRSEGVFVQRPIPGISAPCSERNTPCDFQRNQCAPRLISLCELYGYKKEGGRKQSPPLVERSQRKQMMEIWTNHLETCITSRRRSGWLRAAASDSAMSVRSGYFRYAFGILSVCV